MTAVMVAMDKKDKPSSVPNWLPQSEQDKRRRDSVLKLMAMRDQLREEMTTYVDN